MRAEEIASLHDCQSILVYSDPIPLYNDINFMIPCTACMYIVKEKSVLDMQPLISFTIAEIAIVTHIYIYRNFLMYTIILYVLIVVWNDYDYACTCSALSMFTVDIYDNN